MSGGSYDYAYHNIERFADALEDGRTYSGWKPENADSHVRLGFAAHLRKVATAMKAIEWEDSGDTGTEETALAIHAVTGV